MEPGNESAPTFSSNLTKSIALFVNLTNSSSRIRNRKVLYPSELQVVSSQSKMYVFCIDHLKT